MNRRGRMRMEINEICPLNTNIEYKLLESFQLT